MPQNNPMREERMADIVRGFVDEVRDYLGSVETEAEREVLVDRCLGSLAAGSAAVLTMQRKHDALAATLFAVAVRLWTRGPEAEQAA